MPAVRKRLHKQANREAAGAEPALFRALSASSQAGPSQILAQRRFGEPTATSRTPTGFWQEWCPGAELNHRHTDFQSIYNRLICSKFWPHVASLSQSRPIDPSTG